MRILYTSDLHGCRDGYEKTLERAVEYGVAAIVNGGDIYPLGPDLLEIQRGFLQGFFKDYLGRCARAGIDYLCTLGNMDLRGLDDEFRQIMETSERGHSILEESRTLGGFTFIGMSHTTDGPFSLKDRCYRDTADSVPSPQHGRALVSDSHGLREVEDWTSYVAGLPTLEDTLESLPLPENAERAVYVFHQPPYGVGQGMISRSIDVGSKAVAAFLAGCGAPLSLHGHIHESPFVGGSWRSRIGRTTCVQPGQLAPRDCVSTLIDLETLEMERRT